MKSVVMMLDFISAWFDLLISCRVEQLVFGFEVRKYDENSI